MSDFVSDPFEKAVSNTIQLYEVLRDMGIRDHTGRWLDFLHWNQPIGKKQKRACVLLKKIVKIVSDQNDQVSSRLIQDRVVKLVEEAVWYSKDVPYFSERTREEIQFLFDHSSSRTIDIPIEYLNAGEQSVKFGLVTFINVSTADRIGRWWQNILGLGGAEETIHVYAHITNQGDLNTAKENARLLVIDTLNYLRAIGFPITTRPQHQFGLLNEYSSIQALPYRIGVPKESHRLEYPVQNSIRIGPGVFFYDIHKDLLNKISSQTLDKLQALIENDYYNPSSELKRKFFLGLRWLGEATKPDTLETRFVKLSFSLEGFIGGGISDSRNTKRILAKRAAIITGGDSKKQKYIYDAIHICYDKRSNIVHGNNESVHDHFMEFGQIIREIAWGLLEILDRFKTIDELDSWVSSQKFPWENKIYRG